MLLRVLHPYNQDTHLCVCWCKYGSTNEEVHLSTDTLWMLGTGLRGRGTWEFLGGGRGRTREGEGRLSGTYMWLNPFPFHHPHISQSYVSRMAGAGFRRPIGRAGGNKRKLPMHACIGWGWGNWEGLG